MDEETRERMRRLGCIEVIELGGAIHYAFEEEQEASLFRAAAELLGVEVIEEALFDNTRQAEDERWYVTVLGEEAER